MSITLIHCTAVRSGPLPGVLVARDALPAATGTLMPSSTYSALLVAVDSVRSITGKCSADLGHFTFTWISSTTDHVSSV